MSQTSEYAFKLYLILSKTSFDTVQLDYADIFDYQLYNDSFMKLESSQYSAALAIYLL